MGDFASTFDGWAEIKSITKVLRMRKIDGNTSEEAAYFISSHPYHSEAIKKAIRNHWHVENRLHWQLDISFKDHCRARLKNEAASIALLRRISMAYLKKDIKTKAGIKCKRKKAGWDDTYLMEIVSNFVQISDVSSL